MRNWKARRRSRERERRTLSFFPPRKLSVVTYSFCISLIVGKAGRGQGELPQAAGRLFEVAADGEQERTAHNIAVVQQGRMRHESLSLSSILYYYPTVPCQ